MINRQQSIKNHTFTDPNTQGRACSWDTSMVMWGELTPHKDLAISVKLGSVMGLLSGVFTHWVKIFGTPVLSLVPMLRGW